MLSFIKCSCTRHCAHTVSLNLDSSPEKWAFPSHFTDKDTGGTEKLTTYLEVVRLVSRDWNQAMEPAHRSPSYPGPLCPLERWDPTADPQLTV